MSEQPQQGRFPLRPRPQQHDAPAGGRGRKSQPLGRLDEHAFVSGAPLQRPPDWPTPQEGADMPKGIPGRATCSVDGCDGVVHGRKWCRKHYARWVRTGDPLGFKPKREVDQMARFFLKVDRTGSCWAWKGKLTDKGYGRFWVNGTGVYAHVWTYTHLVGPVPGGLELDHLCRNRACCNPEHVEPVTHQENCRRGTAGMNLAQRTHCPQGHPYDEVNTYVAGGKRSCRECRREHVRQYRLRKRAA